MSQTRPFGLWSRKVIFGATLGAAVVFMMLGVAIWGGFNWSMEITNTEQFCISCHEMKENVYAEYRGSVHDANRSGVGAACPDCHVPRPWVHKIKRKIQASNELFHKIIGSVDTPEKFDAERLNMAQRVWAALKETDSRECRNCHDWGTMNPERQKPRARQQHLFAMEKGHTCIDCHKGIAHKKVHTQLAAEELERLAAPRAEFVRAVPDPFREGLARAEEAERAADQATRDQARVEREARIAAAKAEQERIDAAVDAAVARLQAEQAGAAEPGAVVSEVPAPAAAPAAFSVDWSKAPERLITLFYPGQTSMEWTLVGTMHGGALPFKAGDRCVTCHDKETALMGGKMARGEKAEPTPPVGKRPSIPVTVQATHDNESLYLRFQWEDSPHVPLPFVEGGKLDPENPVKLAIMLASDDVQYASQAGCWGTCHVDLRGMPLHPDDPASAGLALDLGAGVTKYIKESRTKVEEAGRLGAKLGGWNKLKDQGAVESELAAGHFMDLIRWSSGTGAVENGHVLEQRVMNGGAPVEVHGELAGGFWNLEIRRPLKSDAPGDISIEPGKLYNFGFAIHDDFTNARFHHVSLGYRLGLDNPEAEINAVAQ